MQSKTHGILGDQDDVERNVSHMFLGKAYQVEADLKALGKRLVMVMLCCVAIDYAMHKFFTLEEDNSCEISSSQMVESWDFEGGNAYVFNSEMYDEACILHHWIGCKDAFSFDPSGTAEKMLVLFWETGIWPFDPGGRLHAWLLRA